MTRYKKHMLHSIIKSNLLMNQSNIVFPQNFEVEYQNSILG